MLLYALISLVLGVYAILDVLRTPASAMRTLPKSLWLLAVLPPLFGPAAWLLAGRPRREDWPAAGRPVAAPPVPPDDDPEFLRELRRRADDQRRRARDPRDDAA